MSRFVFARSVSCATALVGLLCGAGVVGCATVSPAARANFSKPEMTPAADADEESFHTHVEAAREGSMGGHGAAGGGCGCG